MRISEERKAARIRVANFRCKIMEAQEELELTDVEVTLALSEVLQVIANSYMMEESP